MLPFSFGIDETLTIRYIGSAFENIFDNQDIVGFDMYSLFDLIRPTMKVDWQSVN